MKGYGKKLMLAGLLASFPFLLPAWDKRDGGDFLQPGRRTASSIVLSEGEIAYSYRTFKVRVSDNVFRMDIKLDNSAADLDIYVNYDREISDYDEADFASTEELYNEKFTLSRMSAEPLRSGIYYIDVVYPLDRLPVIGDRQAGEISFGLTVRFVSFPDPRVLIPGEPAVSTLSSDSSLLKLYAVDIPSDVEYLRIDLFNSVSDIDMYVSREHYPFSPEEADFLRESYLGRESLVIGKNSPLPLKAGRYYISVFDRVDDDLTDSFSLLATFSPSVPPFLMEFPTIPDPVSEPERAVAATVEVSTETGAGSGCLVSPGGLIITGLHVIRDASGEIPPTVNVSMTLSLFDPPRELFRADVVDVREDRDLALLKISAGFYGQPLPDGIRFPFYEISDGSRVSLGQELSFLGYPQIGGEGSRVSISLTRGIVSGFNRTDFGYLIKTDGEINSGNSGGAAFDGNYRLIGFPMSVISDEGGQIAYIHPVSLIPPEWIERLHR